MLTRGAMYFGTGTAYTIKDFLGFAFSHVGLGWEKYVRFDERYLRPAKVILADG